MNATTQLSGVRSPFSLSFGRFPFDELIHFSFLYWRYQLSEVDREVRDLKREFAVWLAPATFHRSQVAWSPAHPTCRELALHLRSRTLRLHEEGQKWNGRSERATLAKYEGVTGADRLESSGNKRHLMSRVMK